MASNATDGVGGWRFGMHPDAIGAVVRAVDRVELEIGDALRVEMETPGRGDVRHVQVFIATKSGGWAMWISSTPGELAGHEARLAMIKPPDDDASDDDGGEGRPR